jgi:hypothetical protein
MSLGELFDPYSGFEYDNPVLSGQNSQYFFKFEKNIGSLDLISVFKMTFLRQNLH